MKGWGAMSTLLEVEKYFDDLARRRKELHELPKKRKIREFHLPRLNFEAKHFYEMVKWKKDQMEGPHDPPKILTFPIYTLNYKGPTEFNTVGMPPLLAHMDAQQIDELKECPLTSDFECHTQSVERGVATTAQSVKRRRTDESQLRMALSTVAAREEIKESVTIKRLKENFSKFMNENDQ